MPARAGISGRVAAAAAAALLWLLWLLGPAVRAQPGAEPAAADLLLRNGRVVTMDAAGAVTDAVAVRGERVAALGRDAEAMAGPGTRVVDLGGRTVVPGLIDSHLHQHAAALNALHLQLLGARSIAGVARLVGERARATPPGEWVQASSGWHESLLAEGRLPTRWELDAASPDNPVFIPRGGHVVAVSSRALEGAGIARDTPQPQGGVVVKREGDGEPTGVLLIAGATGLVRRVLPPPPPPDEQARLLRGTMRELNGHGSVAVVEPGIDDRVAAVYRRNRDTGEATVRTISFGAPRRASRRRAGSPPCATSRTTVGCARSASGSRSTAASRAGVCASPTASSPASRPTRPTAASC